jgi:hypothetical protein
MTTRGVIANPPRYVRPMRANELGISGVCLCDHPVDPFENRSEECRRCHKLIMPSGRRLAELRERARAS